MVWDKYGTLCDVTREQLEKIDGFGEVRVEQYLENKNNWSTRKASMEAFNYGIEFKIETTNTDSDTFKDLVVCFSGIRDKGLTQYIISNGGQASDNWTKTTNCLIVKDKNSTSSKTKKALQMGIKILSLDEAYEEFDYHGL